MEPVQLWTGRTACALQAALRMTNESFAGVHSGVPLSWAVASEWILVDC